MMIVLLNPPEYRGIEVVRRPGPPIEEPEPERDPPPVEEPEYPDDPGPAEDPEEQPVQD
jgi:hypothetical protein